MKKKKEVGKNQKLIKIELQKEKKKLENNMKKVKKLVMLLKEKN